MLDHRCFGCWRRHNVVALANHHMTCLRRPRGKLLGSLALVAELEIAALGWHHSPLHLQLCSRIFHRNLDLSITSDQDILRRTTTHPNLPVTSDWLNYLFPVVLPYLGRWAWKPTLVWDHVSMTENDFNTTTSTIQWFWESSEGFWISIETIWESTVPGCFAWWLEDHTLVYSGRTACAEADDAHGQNSIVFGSHGAVW